MSNISEVSTWTANVHELATTDPVEGGPGGISNAQAQALANRTLWLKNFLESIMAPFIGTGGMVLWNRPAGQIPPGWQEVIDWRGRMPIGVDPADADFNTINTNGGSKTKSIGLNNMPAHEHRMFTTEELDDPVNPTNDAYKIKNTPTASVAGAVAAGGGYAYAMVKSSSGAAPTAGRTSQVGGSQNLNVMNPNRTVYFIEWIGGTP